MCLVDMVDLRGLVDHLEVVIMVWSQKDVALRLNRWVVFHDEVRVV